MLFSRLLCVAGAFSRNNYALGHDNSAEIQEWPGTVITFLDRVLGRSKSENDRQKCSNSPENETEYKQTAQENELSESLRSLSARRVVSVADLPIQTSDAEIETGVPYHFSVTRNATTAAQYMTNVEKLSDTNGLGRTTSLKDAGTFYFENAAADGKYYVYTYKDGTKRYFTFAHKGEDGAHLRLAEKAIDAECAVQAIPINTTKNGKNYTFYAIKRNSKNINQFSQFKGDRFACWKDEGNSDVGGYMVIKKVSEVKDPLDIDGKMFIVVYDNKAAMTATTSGNGLGKVTVTKNSDGTYSDTNAAPATPWLFTANTDGTYRISTTVEGQTKYLSMNSSQLLLSDTPHSFTLDNTYPNGLVFFGEEDRVRIQYNNGFFRHYNQDHPNNNINQCFTLGCLQSYVTYDETVEVPGEGGTETKQINLNNYGVPLSETTTVDDPSAPTYTYTPEDGGVSLVFTFMYWKDEEGNKYTPGDNIREQYHRYNPAASLDYIELHLTSVWVSKGGILYEYPLYTRVGKEDEETNPNENHNDLQAVAHTDTWHDTDGDGHGYAVLNPIQATYSSENNDYIWKYTFDHWHDAAVEDPDDGNYYLDAERGKTRIAAEPESMVTLQAVWTYDKRNEKPVTIDYVIEQANPSETVYGYTDDALEQPMQAGLPGLALREGETKLPAEPDSLLLSDENSYAPRGLVCDTYYTTDGKRYTFQGWTVNGRDIQAGTEIAVDAKDDGDNYIYYDADRYRHITLTTKWELDPDSPGTVTVTNHMKTKRVNGYVDVQGEPITLIKGMPYTYTAQQTDVAGLIGAWVIKDDIMDENCIIQKVDKNDNDDKVTIALDRVDCDCEILPITNEITDLNGARNYRFWVCVDNAWQQLKAPYYLEPLAIDASSNDPKINWTTKGIKNDKYRQAFLNDYLYDVFSDFYKEDSIFFNSDSVQGEYDDDDYKNFVFGYKAGDTNQAKIRRRMQNFTTFFMTEKDSYDNSSRIKNVMYVPFVAEKYDSKDEHTIQTNKNHANLKKFSWYTVSIGNQLYADYEDNERANAIQVWNVTDGDPGEMLGPASLERFETAFITEPNAWARTGMKLKVVVKVPDELREKDDDGNCTGMLTEELCLKGMTNSKVIKGTFDVDDFTYTFSVDLTAPDYQQGYKVEYVQQSTYTVTAEENETFGTPTIIKAVYETANVQLAPHIARDKKSLKALKDKKLKLVVQVPEEMRDKGINGEYTGKLKEELWLKGSNGATIEGIYDAENSAYTFTISSLKHDYKIQIAERDKRNVTVYAQDTDKVKIKGAYYGDDDVDLVVGFDEENQRATARTSYAPVVIQAESADENLLCVRFENGAPITGKASEEIQYDAQIGGFTIPADRFVYDYCVITRNSYAKNRNYVVKYEMPPEGVDVNKVFRHLPYINDENMADGTYSRVVSAEEAGNFSLPGLKPVYGNESPVFFTTRQGEKYVFQGKWKTEWDPDYPIDVGGTVDFLAEGREQYYEDGDLVLRPVWEPDFNDPLNLDRRKIMIVNRKKGSQGQPPTNDYLAMSTRIKYSTNKPKQQGFAPDELVRLSTNDIQYSYKKQSGETQERMLTVWEFEAVPQPAEQTCYYRLWTLDEDGEKAYLSFTPAASLNQGTDTILVKASEVTETDEIRINLKVEHAPVEIYDISPYFIRLGSEAYDPNGTYMDYYSTAGLVFAAFSKNEKSDGISPLDYTEEELYKMIYNFGQDNSETGIRNGNRWLSFGEPVYNIPIHAVQEVVTEDGVRYVPLTIDDVEVGDTALQTTSLEVTLADLKNSNPLSYFKEQYRDKVQLALAKYIPGEDASYFVALAENQTNDGDLTLTRDMQASWLRYDVGGIRYGASDDAKGKLYPSNIKNAEVDDNGVEKANKGPALYIVCKAPGTMLLNVEKKWTDEVGVELEEGYPGDDASATLVLHRVTFKNNNDADEVVVRTFSFDKNKWSEAVPLPTEDKNGNRYGYYVTETEYAVTEGLYEKLADVENPTKIVDGSGTRVDSESTVSKAEGETYVEKNIVVSNRVRRLSAFTVQKQWDNRYRSLLNTGDLKVQVGIYQVGAQASGSGGDVQTGTNVPIPRSVVTMDQVWPTEETVKNNGNRLQATPKAAFFQYGNDYYLVYQNVSLYIEPNPDGTYKEGAMTPKPGNGIVPYTGRIWSYADVDRSDSTPQIKNLHQGDLIYFEGGEYNGITYEPGYYVWTSGANSLTWRERQLPEKLNSPYGNPNEMWRLSEGNGVDVTPTAAPKIEIYGDQTTAVNLETELSEHYTVKPYSEAGNVILTKDNNWTRTLLVDSGYAYYAVEQAVFTADGVQLNLEDYDIGISYDWKEAKDEQGIAGDKVTIKNTFDPIARVSTDNGGTWKYFSKLTNGGAEGAADGAFDYANKQTGDNEILIELLYQSREPYALEAPFTFTCPKVRIRKYEGVQGAYSTLSRKYEGKEKGKALLIVPQKTELVLENIQLNGQYTGALAYVKGKLTIDGKSHIFNGAGTEGGAVYVDANGELLMNSTNAVIEDSKADRGGAVYVSGGTFTMSNGTVQDCQATNNGGAVYVASGTFTMNNGTVQNSKAKNNGGAVYMASGTFDMKNGSSLKQNSAAYGGGVYVAAGANLTMMSNASITGNQTTNSKVANGGGVYVDGNATESGTVHVKGNVKISGNTDSTLVYASNLAIYRDESLVVDGELDKNKADIGICTLKEDDIDQIGVEVSVWKNLNKITYDRNPSVYAIPFGKKKVVWSFAPVCMLTDSSDNVLYRDTDLEPCVYMTLKEGFEAAAGRLYGKDGKAIQDNAAIKLKMLRDYVTPEAVTNTAARPLTFTTASGTATKDVNGNEYAFSTTRTGDEANKAIVSRGYNGASMITSSGSLTLQNITLDGNKDNKHTCNTDGGIVNIAAGSLTVSTGATLQNASTTGNGGAVCVNSGASVSMADGAMISGCSAANGGAIYNASMKSNNVDTVVLEDGFTISGNDAANGGAVYMNCGTMKLTSGTIKDNTASTKGAGVYLAEGSALKISGKPSFGGTGVTDAEAGTLDNSSGNLLAGDISATNGSAEYTKARQDIYIAGYSDVTPANSLVVAGNLTGETGSIWVWAENAPHIRDGEQFAVMTGGPWTGLSVFRDARIDADTGASSEFLRGVAGDVSTYVYWGSNGVDVRFKKIDGYGDPLSGAEFTLYTDAACTTAFQKSGSNMTATSAVGDTGTDAVVLFEKVPNGVYYMKDQAAGYAESGTYILLVGQASLVASGALWETGAAMENITQDQIDAQTTAYNTAYGVDKYAIFLLEDGKAVASPDIAAYGIMNTKNPRKVMLEKVNEGKNALAGARFRIFRADMTEVTDGQPTYKTGDTLPTGKSVGDSKGYYESGASGVYFIGKLPLGKYYLAEIQAPEDFAGNQGKVFALEIKETISVSDATAAEKAAVESVIAAGSGD